MCFILNKKLTSWYPKPLNFYRYHCFPTKKEASFLILMPSEIVSGLFQPVLAFYRLFQVVLLFRSNDVTECFDLHFYFKATSCRCYYKVGQLWCMYYKVGQVLLQRGTAFCISKLDKWYDKVRHVLQITANCHTKCRTFHRTFSVKNGCS